MPGPQHTDAPVFTGTRLPAIDTMRGIVMVLMAMDHASHVFNAGRYTRDSFSWYPAGSEIPAAQFITRWVTHLCAPTFLFLAGLVLALSVAKRQARGDPERTIDADIIKRGIFILLLDPLWMSFGFGEGTILQVLYAIGVSLCCMVLLRRLGTRSLFVMGLGFLFFGEALWGLAVWAGDGQRSGLLGKFLVTGGAVTKGIYVLYPVIPWLAYMILGWACGKHMLKNNTFNPVRCFTIAGTLSLLAFFIVRGFNQYGNMLLYRYENSPLQWLHVSKYPPSLTFSALELGLMFLILAFLFAWYRNRNASAANPLQVFGRTPLFFYIIHVHL
ncbi:MAG: heparan-alpha-glucosaminide N-acetyltransferase domain-containing protein, partial [Desulfobacterales bacterium]|nr:heparan-alpha-glucosaminide N-acetyltransferase domain-containing protein [Desulfobacterales bacterium]